MKRFKLFEAMEVSRYVQLKPKTHDKYKKIQGLCNKKNTKHLEMKVEIEYFVLGEWMHMSNLEA